MIILGVDPGTLVTGYGIVEYEKSRIAILACGAVKNDSRTRMPDRLKLIYETLSDVIERFRPDEFALETAFYGRNAQSALKLGHARGVAMLAAVSHGLPTHEYSPREVKKAIVGKGTASKQQVQKMVTSLLRLKQTPRYYDTTDALAVAICHLHRNETARRGPARSWKSYLKVHPEKVSR